MSEATKAFEAANEDCSNVIETFLEPLRLNLELPDYSRLDKPKKPPVPEVGGGNISFWFLSFSASAIPPDHFSFTFLSTNILAFFCRQ